MPSSALDTYRSFDQMSDRLADSAVIRRLAGWLADRLPNSEITLLGRTDAALILCSASAMLRRSPTRVQRAPLGRTGWQPEPGAVLVEPVAPAPGLIATLNEAWPHLKVLVVPSDVMSDLEATRGLAA
jgi:hypothetical protein